MLVISLGRSARFVSFLYCRNTRPKESSTETHRFVRNVRQGHRAARQQQDAPNSIAGRSLPSGRSRVLLGVRTTGRLLLCLPPRRNPVLDVSTSDMMPGSSSNNIVEEGGGYPRGRGDWNNQTKSVRSPKHCPFSAFACLSSAYFLFFFFFYETIVRIQRASIEKKKAKERKSRVWTTIR